MAVTSSRYGRQEIFYGIGPEGQKKLKKGRVAIVEMSAIGTAVANNLTRAGVGFLRLIDGDYIDVSELQRQSLFTEEDAHEERETTNERRGPRRAIFALSCPF